MDKWISVEDRLPAIGEWVNVYAAYYKDAAIAGLSFHLGIGYIDRIDEDGHQWLVSRSPREELKRMFPSHWRPLSSPPDREK